jgi:hypothetical protein
MVEPLQKIQQLVSREPAVMAVHQMGHLRLRNAKELADLLLFEFSRIDDLMDAKADLRAGKKLVRVLEAQIGQRRCRCLLQFLFFSFIYFASSFASRIAARLDPHPAWSRIGNLL